jgi:hypothetical protein
MRIQTFFCAMILAVSACPVVCSAQEFSADVFYLTGSKGRPGASNSDETGHSSKLFVSKDKMRLEPRDHAGTILVINRAQDTAFAIVPKTKEYEPLTSGVSEYFPVNDAENACSEWQRAGTEKIECEKAGHETIGGRTTVKYRNKAAAESGISAVWIDVELKYVVKWESSTTGAELRNIQQAHQPDDLFTLPSDFDLSKPRKGSGKGFSNHGR